MAELLVKTVKEWNEMSGQAIADEIKTFYKDDNFKSSEERSWCNSLPELVRVIDEAGFGDLMLVVEFKLPIDQKRADAVLLGNKRTDKKPFALIIELKQWSLDEIKIKGEKILVRGKDGDYEDDHPISRTEQYLKILKQNFTNVNNGKLEVEACQYLHNFDKGDKDALFEGVFENYKDKVDSLFCKGEETFFASFIKNLYIPSETDNRAKILLEKGEFCYSEQDIEVFERIIDNPRCITLMEDQKPIKEKIDGIFNQLFSDKLKKNQMMIISGAVGTGKTYAGLYIISRYCQLAREKGRELKFAYTLPYSQTLREVISNYLSVPTLFAVSKMNLDLLVIDEAHRVTNNDFRTLEQARAKIVVVLQDDRQRVLPIEKGTIEEFIKFAKRNQYEFYDDFSPYVLKTQKRSGLSNYVNRIDSLLYGDKIQELEMKNGIDIKICDTLDEFEECFEEKYNELQEAQTQTKNLNDRISIKYLAPLCWEWKSRRGKLEDDDKIYEYTKNGKEISYDIVIPKDGEAKLGEHQYKNQWHPNPKINSKDKKTLFKWYKYSKLVGSVFNAQGLEFDFVSLIWWDDLKWDKEKKVWRVDFKKEDYPKLSGLDNENYKYIMLNIYRVLLTRAKKGIFIWFVDEATKGHFKEVMDN